jgi:hypothetical protein
MKRFLFALILLSGPGPVRAQVPIEEGKPLVNEYIDDGFEQRSRTWWRALESQLVLSLDRPADRVAEVSLQNVIYFATNHRDRVDLGEAAPLLMNVYRNHDLVGFRMMALSALHAIGDENYLREAYAAARRGDSDRVRKMARAALADVYRKGN